jgi:hypothetical protein
MYARYGTHQVGENCNTSMQDVPCRWCSCVQFTYFRSLSTKSCCQKCRKRHCDLGTVALKHIAFTMHLRMSSVGMVSLSFPAQAPSPCPCGSKRQNGSDVRQLKGAPRRESIARSRHMCGSGWRRQVIPAKVFFPEWASVGAVQAIIQAKVSHRTCKKKIGYFATIRFATSLTVHHISIFGAFASRHIPRMDQEMRAIRALQFVA